MTYGTVTGELTTEVALNYSGCELSVGKWIKQPSGSLSTGTHEIFKASNRDAALYLPEGWVSYLASDGTQFKFTFSDPLNWANTCTSSMENVHGPYYLPEPEYPKSGNTWTVTYYISFMTDFCDLPVDSEQIIREYKCADFSEERVRGMLGDHEAVSLKQILAADIPAEAKLWCVVSPLFLTPGSKAILTRDLAQLAVQSLSGTGLISPSLLDSALLTNQEFLNGSIGVGKLQSMRRLLEERARAANAVQRDADIVNLVATLTEKCAVNGWIHAVSTYLSGAEDAELARRTADVLKIVETRIES